MNEPTTLKIYRGTNGQFTLYEDDGISQNYLKGKASWTNITWNDKEKQLTIAPGAPKGFKNEVNSRTFKIQLIPGNETKTVFYEGRPVKVKF